MFENNFVAIKNAQGVESQANVFNLQVSENINEFATCTFSLLSERQNLIAIEELQPFSQFFVPAINQWFQITNVSSTAQTDTRLFNVQGVQIATRLHNKYIDDKLTNTQSIQACMDYLTKDTEFSYQVHDNFDNYYFSDGFGGAFADDLLLNTILPDFNCEVTFDNDVIHIYKSLGNVDQFVFVDGYNVQNIGSSEDYTSMATYIKGTGKPNQGDGATGYQATADYTSPNAQIYGIIQAQTISDERFTDSTSLQNYLKTQLQDYPIVQYTVDRAEFEHNAKLEGQNKIVIGNYGLLKDRLGIDVDVRIIGKTYYPNDPTQSDTVTFGNKLFDFAFNLAKQQKAQGMNKNIGQQLSGINDNINLLFDGQIGLDVVGKVAST